MIVSVRQSDFRQGSTLLAVFWIMAILGLAIVASMRVVNYQVKVIDAQLSGADSLMYAERGIAVATNPAIERSDPLLRQTFPEGGGYEASIKSEGGRFNINYILGQRDKALLRLIFDYWGMDQDVAGEISDALLDWVDPGDTEELNGAEFPYYESIGQVGYPFNRPFYKLDEMRLVRGMDIVESFQPDWRDWFTVYSSGPLDPNEAPAEFIAIAMEEDIEDANVIVERRNGDDGIKDTEDDRDVSARDIQELIEDDGSGIRIGRFGGRDNVTRIESTGFVGDVRRKIVLIIDNPQRPQIRDRRVELVP